MPTCCMHGRCEGVFDESCSIYVRRRLGMPTGHALLRQYKASVLAIKAAAGRVLRCVLK